MQCLTNTEMRKVQVKGENIGKRTTVSGSSHFTVCGKNIDVEENFQLANLKGFFDEIPDVFTAKAKVCAAWLRNNVSLPPFQTCVCVQESDR